MVIYHSNEIEVKKMPNEKGGKKIIAVNRKARHDYFVEDTYEAGIALYGTEVKSVRAGQVNLKDSYCSVKNGELYALGIHISPYEKGNIFNRDPLREKKLLMHKKEILKLFQYTTRDSYTLVPLSMYFSGSHVKVEVESSLTQTEPPSPSMPERQTTQPVTLVPSIAPRMMPIA